MRIRRLLGRVPVAGWVVAGLVLAGLVAWPLGGWDTVALTSRAVPSYDRDQTMEGHRFDITVGDLRLSETSPAGYDADAGETFLILAVEVVNVSTESTGVSPLDGVIVPDDQRLADVYGSYFLVDDGTPSPELNPDLPREIEIVWTVDSRVFTDGDTVTFRLQDSLPRKAVLYRGITWLDYFEAGTAERVVGG